ncbi:MAG: hypothetical protein JRE28_16420 [Deltaproteobacteria bacterium]|nr:hypothetical protein [Deltaproteobacteria bacterium]
MPLYNENKLIELRILGPEGRPYVELENEFTELFRTEGFEFRIPRLFSAPPETTVLITIGIGVITGVSSYLLTALIEKIFNIKKDKTQNHTIITFNIHVGDNKYIKLPNNKEELLKELQKTKDNGE